MPDPFTRVQGFLESSKRLSLFCLFDEFFQKIHDRQFRFFLTVRAIVLVSIRTRFECEFLREIVLPVSFIDTIVQCLKNLLLSHDMNM